MNPVPALLIAFATAITTAAMLAGRSARRPLPARHAQGQARPGAWTIPRLRRPSNVVRPTALAAWADDLARALRHGSTLHTALANTVPADSVVQRRSTALRHWLDRGATVAEACDEWADELAESRPQRTGWLGHGRDRSELLLTMAAVLSATASLGGAAASPLDRYAVAMRQRASDDLERGAHSAQARMSARVLTSVPLGVLALLVLTDADVRNVIASSTGGAAVACGLALNAVGAFWMRRIAGGPC